VIIDHTATTGNARAARTLRTVIDVSGSRSNPLDDLVHDLIPRIPEPLSLVPGPWPVPTGQPGVGDDALRALLADDWAGTKMSPAKLRKLIDTQLVSRHRELAADHPDARDLGICSAGATVGRLLLDLDTEQPGDRPPVILVDMALRPDRLRQGVGSRVVEALLTTAGEHQRSVHATCVYGSAALGWLLRLGLVDVGGDALYRQLVWPGP
jgi:GNAT superfamily N-acetyltransferase